MTTLCLIPRLFPHHLKATRMSYWVWGAVPELLRAKGWGDDRYWEKREACLRKYGIGARRGGSDSKYTAKPGLGLMRKMGKGRGCGSRYETWKKNVWKFSETIHCDSKPLKYMVPKEKLFRIQIVHTFFFLPEKSSQLSHPLAAIPSLQVIHGSRLNFGHFWIEPCL